MVWIISHVTIVGILVSNLFHMSVADSECFACVRPANCAGRTCDIVGGCGEGVPVGYYPDLTKANSYCYCTGTAASSRYETCHPASLLWDTHQQGNNYYLEGNWGKDGLWGTNGGGCSWNWQVSNKGNDRPGIDGNPIVTDFSVDPDGNVCGTQIIESPTNSPTESPTASTIVSSPTEEPSTLETSSPQQCEDNLGNIVANTLDKNTWTTLTNGFPLFTDDGVNVMVAGDFTSQAGAELEGASVTLGNFHVMGAGLSNVGVVGAGSQVVPNDGEDSWIVGGNLILDRTVQYMNGNVLVGGELLGSGSIGSIYSGTIQQGANIDINGYETMFAELKTKADYWASLPANGVWELRGGNTLVFKRRDNDNDVLQVFSISGDDLNYNYGVNVNFDSNLGDKTILINVHSNSAKEVVVKNLSDFYDPDGNRHWSFQTKYSANILWNFHDAMTVDIGGGASGNGEFTGSIIVPSPGCEVTMTFPGSSGRFIVNGDAIQNRGGHEFHNFPFQPPAPLPLPPSCDGTGMPTIEEQTTAAPTSEVPSLSPSTSPSESLSSSPSESPSSSPSTSPSSLPSLSPSSSPSRSATPLPTTAAPSSSPSASPSESPSSSPSESPSTSPSRSATASPTTAAPTATLQSDSPSDSPTRETLIGAFGDPHIKTWAGRSYDFHGICDLVLFSNPNFDKGSGIDVHIRNRQMEMWSFIETSAIRIGNEKFEISGGKDNDTFLINGIVHKIEGESGVVGTISGYNIKFIQVNEKSREFVINLGTNRNNNKDESIIFKTWNSFVSVSVNNPTKDHFDGSLGLMGSFPAGVMVARDGNTVFDNTNEFGQEWQVLSSEPHLFTKRGTVGPDDVCSSPSNIEMRRRLQGSVVTLKEAEIACDSVNVEMKDLCIFDVIATNDISSVGAY